MATTRSVAHARLPGLRLNLQLVVRDRGADVATDGLTEIVATIILDSGETYGAHQMFENSNVNGAVIADALHMLASRLQHQHDKLTATEAAASDTEEPRFPPAG